MKAIHNMQQANIQKMITVFNTSKIQNESNSQHKIVFFLNVQYCFQYFKDTK